MATHLTEAEKWELIAPRMGYMALLRNLRNLDEAGVTSTTSAKLAARLANPEEIKRSRLLPYRFLTAYLEAPSDRWKQALEEAVNASLASVPELPGRTLVLVDTSGSMTQVTMSQKSKVTPAMAAALFGTVLAQRNHGRVDLYGFADYAFEHKLPKGQGVLAAAGSLVRRTNEAGWGTQMTASLRQAYSGHDRVFIISDMQVFADSHGRQLSNYNRRDVVPVPEGTKVYGVNIGGYSTTSIDSRVKGRFEFAGLTDSAFQQVLTLESGYDEKWPWMA